MSADDPRFLRWLEGTVNWFRSPRSRRPRSPQGADPQAVIPVRVNLVGEEAPEPAQPSPSHPFGSSLANTEGQEVREWTFAQPVLLRKTRRTSSLLVWTAAGSITAVGIWAWWRRSRKPSPCRASSSPPAP